MTERIQPKHIGFIMDGNGRWATKRGLPRKFGHKAGADALENLCDFLFEEQIPYATFYGFSTENWTRPQEEVQALMDIITQFLEKLIRCFEHPKRPFHSNTNIWFLGDLSVFSEKQKDLIRRITERSASFTGKMTLCIAINYGGRAEIVRAANRFLQKHPDEPLTEMGIAENLDTAGLPDPDLIIRTAGERRLSNFLIWQAAYAEYYATDACWPDFGREELRKALDAYAGRTRKFGGTSSKERSGSAL